MSFVGRQKESHFPRGGCHKNEIRAMRWRFIINIIGVLTFFFGLAMVFPLLVSHLYAENSVTPFAQAMGITTAAGFITFILTRGPHATYLGKREGIAIVSIGWTTICAFGALPFYIDATCCISFVDALFESVSGFTTTGASILTNIEPLSKGLLFWRSLIQWVGGMGIIVLSIAILPFIGVGGMQLYKAEIPSPVPDKLKPRIQDTAMILWKVYALFSLLEVFLLLIGGMDLFDAVCHTLTTMPTGGFSPKNASIGHYNSAFIDAVIIVFMVIAGVNFSLHYKLLLGRPLDVWRDSEFRFYIGTLLILIVLVTFNIYGTVYGELGQAFRYGAFQVVSLLTTTGYATADYEKWPVMSQLILLLVMFLGASAGSTGGGMKCLRIMLCIKHCYNEVFLLVHPHAVTHIKVAGKTVPADVMRSVLGFLALYVGLFILCSILLAAMGLDSMTSVAAVAATIGNIGPGFGMVGPTGNYAEIPFLGKWILIWCMLLGRLEIFTVIILFVPEFWRK
jgi:trk system potassium uptake protein